MKEVKDKSVLVDQYLQPLLHADKSLQLRGKGMIFGLDMGSGERSAAVVQECFKKGLIIAACGTGGKVLKIIPPLTIPKSDLIAGLEILTESVRSVMEKAA